MILYTDYADARITPIDTHNTYIVRLSKINNLKDMSNEKRFILGQNKVPESGLLYQDLTYKIRGCIFTVYNTLGCGHKELIYQNALEQELKKQNLTFEAQKSFNVFYGNKKVGNYRPDLVVENTVIIEIKAANLNLKIFESQLLSYLKATPYQLGLLVNFGPNQLHIKRIINTKSPR